MYLMATNVNVCYRVCGVLIGRMVTGDTSAVVPVSRSPTAPDKLGLKLSHRYSEIPLLRPLKIKTFYPLKTLFAKLREFFSSFSAPSVSLIIDHLWDCPKVVFKTTFGQSQRWS